jgi:hypothetical protein
LSIEQLLWYGKIHPSRFSLQRIKKRSHEPIFSRRDQLDCGGGDFRSGCAQSEYREASVPGIMASARYVYVAS